MVELLEERGIKVLSINLDDIDGLTAKVRRKNGEPVPVIVVKKSAWAEQRSTPSLTSHGNSPFRQGAAYRS